MLLWWTPLMAENERIISCLNAQYKCLLTKNKEHSNNSKTNAILFYGSGFKITNLPVPKSRVWAIFHEESPRNEAVFLYNRTYELFEIVSTFSRHSDFPLTLQYLENLNILTDSQYFVTVEEKNYLLTKDKIAPVLYIQSDCDTPNERDAYVKELMKYIPVDSYGKCLHNKEFPEDVANIFPLDLYNVELLKFVANYKFMIAFENGVCQDYISEKLWRPLMVGTVPIYLGSPSVEDWLPNENSAILAKNFDSPEKLAQYVKKINASDTIYDKFREHQFGKVNNKLLEDTLATGPFGLPSDQEHPISAFECFICQGVHEGFKRKKRRSFYDCAKPIGNNSWDYYWQMGDCQSEVLVNSVKNNMKLEEDPC